jgi:hypothetical protein
MLVEEAGNETGTATSALLARELEGNAQTGYAIVAKCSASLQTELQVMRPSAHPPTPHDPHLIVPNCPLLRQGLLSFPDPSLMWLILSS